jgi:hypothetical protein
MADRAEDLDMQVATTNTLTDLSIAHCDLGVVWT